MTKGQSESLEQIQKRDMYIIAPHLQYKEAITKLNLPTIKDHLDIINSNIFRNIVDNHSHRIHYISDYLISPHPKETIKHIKNKLFARDQEDWYAEL